MSDDDIPKILLRYNIYLWAACFRVMLGNSFVAPWLKFLVSILQAPSEWIYSLTSLRFVVGLG